MTTLSEQDIRKIAHLARLQIPKDELKVHGENLTKILNFVEAINTVDTSDIKPMAHPQNLAQRLREDEVIETNQRELFQKLAPLTEAGLYLVPKVINNTEEE
ncbi:MAG: Asp-tRNA(Asn)/Glu-tRNA(Gln) amidotransferase subunit GatC [Gammaproteobacteria bacterium]|nr:Asp-tRNA(Asn)/Glu-tRNA(Gln) amidotransferase subunit GatC [Gammaproteobacteria bacterium]